MGLLTRWFSGAIGCDHLPTRPCQPSRCPFLACAVQRRRFPVGENPTRQSLQPEAIGAVMEVTKWLKPSISVSRIGDSAIVLEIIDLPFHQSNQACELCPQRGAEHRTCVRTQTLLCSRCSQCVPSKPG